MENKASVTIPSRTGTRISITPLRRSHPAATDADDGNWVECEVTVAAGGFRGRYVASLRSEDFATFRRDLVRLHRDLRGSGVFRTMEGWIALDLEGDGMGHFTGCGSLRDCPGVGNLLQCALDLDRSDLAEIMRELAAVIELYPEVGGAGV
jgi:hypothetical protein